MAVNLSPLGGVGAQFFDSNGNPLSGGLIYTYAAGTSTPQATYTTSAGNIQHSNPIVLDAAGRVPTGEIWLTDGVSYKFTIKTSADVLVGTYDNLVGINSNFIAYTAQQEIQTATAGQTVFNLTTMQYQPGTNNLSVFVDGVNQYGPGAQYAYVETDSDTVTFVSGLHVGASVKFTTAQSVSSSSTDAANVSFTGVKAQTGTVAVLGTMAGSDWVGFQPNGTGAVSADYSIQDKLRQIVSVKDFGAVGDGVTDDTVAIQAALDSLSTGGVLQTIQNETYLIDTVQPSSNTTITGGGTFKFKANTSSFSLVLAELKTKIVLDGLVFDGNITNQSVWSEYRHCVQVLGSASVSIRNCRFQNIIGDGVYVGVSGSTLPSDVKIHANSFVGNNTNRNGVSIVAGSDIEIYGNSFYKMAKSDMPGAVDIEPNVSTSTIYNVNVYGNTFVGNSSPVLQKAIAINNANSASVYNVNIANNSIKDGFYYGIAVFGDASNRTKTKANVIGNIIKSAITLANSCGIIASQACEVNISENKIDTTCDIGIKTLTPTFKISSNKIKNAVKYGVEVLGGVTEGMITGNYIEDCGNNSFAAYGGIHVQGSYLHITDNKMISFSNTKMQTGIYIESGVKNFVDANTVRGANVRAVSFAVAPQMIGQNMYSGGFNSISGTYPPASEAWVAGDIIYNPNPTSGGYIGWVCTTAGTPGTWKTFGAIS